MPRAPVYDAEGQRTSRYEPHPTPQRARNCEHKRIGPRVRGVFWTHRPQPCLPHEPATTIVGQPVRPRRVEPERVRHAWPIRHARRFRFGQPPEGLLDSPQRACPGHRHRIHPRGQPCPMPPVRCFAEHVWVPRQGLHRTGVPRVGLASRPGPHHRVSLPPNGHRYLVRPRTGQSLDITALQYAKPRF